MSDLKRLAFIVGRDARVYRAVIDLDLDHPSPSQQRTFVIVRDDNDIDLLQGYRPGELRYIADGATPRQLAFLAARGHTEISVAEAREWLGLKRKEPSR